MFLPPFLRHADREREAKDLDWEAKKAAKAAEEKRIRKEKRRREKEGDGGGKVLHRMALWHGNGKLVFSPTIVCVEACVFRQARVA